MTLNRLEIRFANPSNVVCSSPMPAHLGPCTSPTVCREIVESIKPRSITLFPWSSSPPFVESSTADAPQHALRMSFVVAKAPINGSIAVTIMRANRLILKLINGTLVEILNY